ncbi:uncharacterized protein LJ264_004779 [Porphyrio hochstetteri]
MELEKNSNVKSNRRCLNQILPLFSYSEEAEHRLIGDVAGANDSGFGQSPSLSPEFKLSEESLPYLSSSLDAAIEMYNKGMRISCAQIDDSEKEADMLGSTYDNTHVSCGVCDDCQQSHLSEDSQLYLSAQELDFDDGDSPSESSEQRGTIAPGPGIAKEQNVVDMSEDCSAAAEYDASDQTCPEAAVPELPHLCQHSLPPACCSGVTYHQEGQAKYRGAVCATILESYSCGNKEGVYSNLLECDSLENREMEDTPLTDSALPPQPATSEELPKNNNGPFLICSVKPEDPHPSRWERAPVVAVRFSECAEGSDFHSCEESGAGDASCTDCTAEGAETPFPVSRTLAYKDPFFGVEAAHKHASGEASCLNLECGESLKTVTSDSTVNQAVDVSSDFRARFTTSRSISAEACLLSRAINTEITMMNKSRPVGWHHKTHAGFACNTNRSCGAGSTKEMPPQLTDVLEEHSDGHNVTAERSSQTEDQSESKQELCSDHVKISTDRSVHLYKEAVKNSASNYCKKILQRAIEAELQVLSTYYQMCYRHCLKIYKLASEENMCLSRGNGDTELGSSLMLVLEELKKNYNSMRMKVKMGIPLNTLPPLSVELKFSTSYVPCKVLREDVSHDSVSDMIKAHFKGPKLQEKKTSVNMDDLQTMCFTDAGQPGDSASSKTFGDQDKECGCVTKEERNEYWFDAKEDLTADSSVISEETKKQEKQGTDDLREVKITESGRECSLTCVGGQSSSASEGDLRSDFQKYQISDTPISVDSSNCRGESLPFKDADKAKLAGEEMNQEKMKGKPLSVKLGNASSENKYLVSQVHANKLWHEVQPVVNSQRNYQEKPLTSASNSVKAPDTSSASEEMHLLPVTASKVSFSVQVPSEATCPARKSATEDSVHCSLRVRQKDTGEKSVQKTSAPFSTHPSDAFMPPDTLNLTSFTKLLKKLQEIHPEVSRDEIVAAVVEVRRNNNGILSGLSISSIVERTSVILRKSSPSSGMENQLDGFPIYEETITSFWKITANSVLQFVLGSTTVDNAFSPPTLPLTANTVNLLLKLQPPEVTSPIACLRSRLLSNEAAAAAKQRPRERSRGAPAEEQPAAERGPGAEPPARSNPLPLPPHRSPPPQPGPTPGSGAATGAGGGSCPAAPLLPRGRRQPAAAEMALLPRRFLCFVLAHHFIAATACQEADYGWMIRHYCLKQFQLSMEGIGQRLWCDWDETLGTYGELTNCTALIAERLDCYWPNRLVDEFFVAVHKQYFRNCSPSGRALHDPPNGVLCPFILLPVLVTLLMTALVVWRSKRSEGIV